jgi:hypothetical protein
MTLRSFLLPAGIAAVAVLSVAARTTAQTFGPFGMPVGGGDDEIVGPMSLPFSFRFPDGTTTTQVEASTNGRVFVAGTGNVDFSETVGEFLSQSSSICAFWDDLDDFGTTDMQVWYAALPGLATITWRETKEFNPFGGIPFTVQVQLRPDDSITVVFDDRVRDGDQDCLIGITDGGGATDPGPIDYSDLATDFVLSGGRTIYEQFQVGEFDLVSGAGPVALTFTLLPTFEYLVSGQGIPLPSRVSPGRESCTSAFGFRLLPNGVGGYDLVAERPDMQSTFGDTVVTTDVMPFTILGGFPFPDGTNVTQFYASRDGRVTTASDYDTTPSTGELLASTFKQICALWGDFDPAFGSVRIGPRRVTWSSVLEVGGLRSSTAQVTFGTDGSIGFSYVFRAEAISDLLIGLTLGNGAPDPGPSDLSSESFAVPMGTFYEFFPAGAAPDLAGDQDEEVELIVVSDPSIDEPLLVDTIDSTGTALAVQYFVGYPTGLLGPPLELGAVLPSLGGCELLTDIVNSPAFISMGVTGDADVCGHLRRRATARRARTQCFGVVLNVTTPPLVQPLNELLVRIGS